MQRISGTELHISDIAGNRSKLVNACDLAVGN